MSAFCAFGCLGEPIPKQVRAGTTFAVPVAPSRSAFGAEAASQGSEGLLALDPQRGNVRFALCSDAQCSTSQPLVLRYLSRMFPDPGSPAALTGLLEASGIKFRGTIRGQTIAVLDVPLDTPPGTYDLGYFVSGGALPDFSITLEPIQIVAGVDEQFSDITTELAVGFDVSESLRDLVPYPRLVLNLLNFDRDRPAAASLVLRHPPQVSIEGAFENGSVGQRSIVRLASGPEPNSVRLMMVDPDQRTFSLGIAFRLMDPSAPVLGTDFVIESQSLYAADGSSLPLADSKEDPGNRFVLPSGPANQIR